MSFLHYSKYRESGVEWLGRVPEHWATKRIKDTTYLKGRVGWKGLKSDEYLESGYAYLVTGTDFRSRFISWKNCHYVDKARYEDDPFIQLRNGDLLITKDGTIGKLALVSEVDRPACLNSGIFLVRPRDSYITEFMYWVLSSSVFQVFCDLASLGSTIQHLYQNVFDNFVFPVPTISEQSCIAVFLDREVEKIDVLIAEQQRLVELLKEKRQAAISHAVTKGLDFDATLRSSGIEWLGDVPAHWGIARLAYKATVENGTTPSRDATDYWIDGDIPWISSGEVNQYRITEATEFITRKALKECSLRVLPVGTIVIGMIGQGKTRGLAAALDIEASINQNLAAILPGPSLKSNFLLYIFQSMYEYLREFGRGGNQAALNCEILSALKIPLPPIEEQVRICDYLQARLNEFSALAAEAERAIDLLLERRAALIAAAVTGQIDVRGLVKAEAA